MQIDIDEDYFGMSKNIAKNLHALSFNKEERLPIISSETKSIFNWINWKDK